LNPDIQPAAKLLFDKSTMNNIGYAGRRSGRPETVEARAERLVRGDWAPWASEVTIAFSRAANDRTKASLARILKVRGFEDLLDAVHFHA